MSTFLNHPAVQAIGWALLHFIWQGTLLAALFALTNRITKSARIRYATGCAAMLLMPAVFVATVLRSERPQVPVILVSYAEPLYTSSGRNLTGRATIVTPAPGTAPANDRSTIPGWIACLWIIGVAAFSISTAAGWLRIQQLTKRGTEPANPAWREALETLRRRLKISKPVRLCTSAIAEVPTVIGWLRPCILLPISAITNLDESQLRAILVHELAHIRRHDYLINLLQNAIETLLFYHPAVWWISRQIRQEREHCCDDLAVEVCGDVILYATALTQLEHLRGHNSEPALAATGGDLLARIRRLIGKRTNTQPDRTAASIIAFLTVVFTAVAFIGAAPQLGIGQSAIKFEVASVKPTLNRSDFISQEFAAGRTSGGGMRVSGLRVDIDSMDMKYLIATAWRKDAQLIIGPDWVNEGEVSFAVHAVMPGGATKDQIPDMMKSLLEERFHMATHLAIVEQPAYALVSGKNGPRLKQPGNLDLATCDNWVEVPVPAGAGNRMCRSTQVNGDRRVSITMMTNAAAGPLLSSTSRDERHEEYFRITMPKLADLLAQTLSTGGWPSPIPASFIPVVDRTGIKGDWDVVLDTNGGLDERLSSYSAALEKQGLKLERTTAPVEKLIIDKVDKTPTEN
jgi:uncharacterized protein (TIGR03435 family)